MFYNMPGPYKKYATVQEYPSFVTRRYVCIFSIVLSPCAVIKFSQKCSNVAELYALQCIST